MSLSLKLDQSQNLFALQTSFQEKSLKLIYWTRFYVKNVFLFSHSSSGNSGRFETGYAKIKQHPYSTRLFQLRVEAISPTNVTLELTFLVFHGILRRLRYFMTHRM